MCLMDTNDSRLRDRISSPTLAQDQCDVLMSIVATVWLRDVLHTPSYQNENKLERRV